MRALAENHRRPQQTTDTVVMIRPDHFGFNEQTAVTNVYQHRPQSEIATRDQALREFDGMTDTLSRHGIKVVTLPSRNGVSTPDAVFPNNWFSHHQEGTLVLYPMLTPNRRDERQVDELVGALTQIDLNDHHILDLTHHEGNGAILEGTGSLVLDRENGIAYAMESARTHQPLFEEWIDKMGYKGVFFHAEDKGKPVYHTNVVMSVGNNFAVACVESITDQRERDKLVGSFQDTGKEFISITREQMDQFSGNILEVQSRTGEPKIVMSDSAYRAFTLPQRRKLEKHGEIVPVSIPTIETVGGGSARCMLAEVFPPLAK